MTLTPSQQRAALDVLAHWRADPRAQIACPACGKPDLSVVDRSARPHAEWYVLTCPACGLNETIHIPLAAPIQTLD